MTTELRPVDITPSPRDLLPTAAVLAKLIDNYAEAEKASIKAITRGTLAGACMALHAMGIGSSPLRVQLRATAALDEYETKARTAGRTPAEIDNYRIAHLARVLAQLAREN